VSGVNERVQNTHSSIKEIKDGRMANCLFSISH
jgi:hypothetical protein